MLDEAAIAAGCFAAAAVGSWRSRRTAASRLERLRAPAVASLSVRQGTSVWWPIGLGVATAAAATQLVGLLAAGAMSCTVAFLVLRGQRSSAKVGEPRRPGFRFGRSGTPASPTDDVPAALDVLAACLTAGASIERALTGVADAFGGETGEILGTVAGLASWGAPAETAWAVCLEQSAWSPVARAVIRASHSGASLTDVLTHQAIDYRRALRASAAAGAQRAGVAAVLPLGLCFLPAFVLAGVVPVVAGFAQTLLH